MVAGPPRGGQHHPRPNFAAILWQTGIMNRSRRLVATGQPDDGPVKFRTFAVVTKPYPYSSRRQTAGGRRSSPLQRSLEGELAGVRVAPPPAFLEMHNA